jgi:hypothetical protein
LHCFGALFLPAFLLLTSALPAVMVGWSGQEETCFVLKKENTLHWKRGAVDVGVVPSSSCLLVDVLRQTQVVGYGALGGRGALRVDEEVSRRHDRLCTMVEWGGAPGQSRVHTGEKHNASM